jgi:hypothetical protein
MGFGVGTFVPSPEQAGSRIEIEISDSYLFLNTVKKYITFISTQPIG